MAIFKLNGNAFDQLLQEQDPMGSSTPTFDLTNVSLVTPAGIVQLVAACHVLAENHKRPQILVNNPDVRTYLLRVGFFAAISTIADIVPPLSLNTGGLYERRRGSSPMLIEVTKIEEDSQLTKILNRVVWVLQNELSYQQSEAFDVATAVSEICQNTFDHCPASCGFFTMQTYDRGVNRFLEIGVADYGDGLVQTLSQNPTVNPASHAEAIRLATRLGISKYEDPTRGTGLHHILKIAHKLSGVVQIRSGDAKAEYRMHRTLAKTVPMFAGVHVAFSLPTRDRP